MFMLYLLLGIAALWLFWLAIVALNDWGETKTGHTFFTAGTIITASVGYWMLFFGYNWYQANKDDPLNGITLILLGAVVLAFLFYHQLNAAQEHQEAALLMTVLFFLLCIPMSVGLFIVLAVLVAWFSETKPVYVINDLSDDD